MVARDIEDRIALGQRLKAARTTAGLTLVDVAARLSEAGYSAKKQAVSAWEHGRNVPDALVLKKLAKLYKQSADALLWDNSLSLDALQFAAQFDALSEDRKRTLRAVWLAFVESGNSADTLPLPPKINASR